MRPEILGVKAKATSCPFVKLMVQRYDLFNWALNEIKNECKQTFRALSY
jgi:hypothetical protein